MRPIVLMLAAGAALFGQAPVTFERLLKADREPRNWLLYSGNYRSYRYSTLAQISSQNARRLRPDWIYQLKTTHKVETSPLVVDGVMYLTRPPNDVVALDADTGRKLWSYEYKLPPKVIVCCGQVNRGLAILGNKLFMATVDAKLLALDARSGRLVWKTELADYEAGYASTAAPLVVKDKIIVGMAGGEYGVRGFIDAYYAATGKRAWRFYTTAGPDSEHPGTWAGDSWKTGGATTWTTGAYDPALNLVYWGTGNPGPDWNPDLRRGDNLYSDSMLALEADSGKLRWYFQFTPQDAHDWDATQVPVLVDAPFRGRPRKLLLDANRNGFFYALDRSTGEYLLGKAYANQTWAKQLDDRGRPVRAPGTLPTPAGVAVWPGAAGAANWYSPSYSPATGLFYAAVREEGEVFYSADAHYRPGFYFLGGEHKPVPGERPYGVVRALVPETGQVRWEHKLLTPPWAGLLTTAGNLVFGGTMEGNFFALDARNGEQLWHFPAGGAIAANPITYLSGGRQHVAIAAGDVMVSFSLGE